MSERAAPAADGLCGVIDLGKTHGRLLVLSADGMAVHEHRWPSGSWRCDAGYAALDIAATSAQIEHGLDALGPLRGELQQVIVSAHGAAVAGLDETGSGLAFAVPDYEWSGFDDRERELAPSLDPFAESLSPLLPQGLNIGVQLAWLERHAPAELARAGTLLPYAQYWSWWLGGVAVSEVSSLGCHSLLWRPRAHRFSEWAIARGLAQRFAPLRPAWNVLGPVRQALASRLNLPTTLRVHVGVHDSNACLAAHLGRWPEMTLVSSGTWVVAMAPGAPLDALDAREDQLGNVSVLGHGVATARFMGGREWALLCAAADPALADLDQLAPLLSRGLVVLPAFAAQGGPFANKAGSLHLDGRTLSLGDWSMQVSPAHRATAAAWYTALMTCELLLRLRSQGPIVIDGPLARNAVAAQVIAALMPGRALHVSTDPVEGTARGAWRLTRWPANGSGNDEAVAAAPVPPPATALRALLLQHHAQWRAALPRAFSVTTATAAH